jgi:hypothetical protein
MSVPHNVTTDFTLTPLPSNGHWLCRAMILCAVRKFGYFSLAVISCQMGSICNVWIFKDILLLTLYFLWTMSLCPRQKERTGKVTPKLVDTPLPLLRPEAAHALRSDPQEEKQ